MFCVINPFFLFLEEKPKESPQTEPKTKRIIGGVGLGNIFDGGPIKLRSATGSKKQPAEPVRVPLYFILSCNQYICCTNMLYE